MTPVEIAELVGGIAAGGVTLSAIISVAVRGYWQKSITPLINEEIKKYVTDKKYVEEHEQTVKDIIDNEVARKDGLISQAIHGEVSELEKRLTSKLDAILQTQTANHQLAMDTLQKLSRLQGSVDNITGRSSASSQSFPAVLPPKRGT